MDPRISDYIRANRRKYTREAITQQLVAAGHDPAEVERVWAALDAPDADRVAGSGFWGRFALILVGINLGVFLLVALLTNMLGAIGQGGIVLPVILAIALGIGALIAWGIVAATGPTKLAPTTALVIGAAIPGLFALLIGGACYAMLGGMGLSGGGGPPPVSGTMTIRLEGAVDVDQRSDAFCQPEDGGFFVNSDATDADGRLLFVSISSFSAGPGDAPQPSLHIELSPMSPAQGESVMVWGSDMGPTVEEIEWSLDAPGGGSVTFRGLPGMDHGPGPEPSALPALSGEISWTCEQ
jgi:hypothetical protein